MNDIERRRLEMFVRVRNFGASLAEDFAPNSVGHQLFTTVGSVVDEIEAQASLRVSGIGSARQGTVTRGQARADLRDTLEAINRTARAMADGVPGLEDKFRVPRNATDQELLATARSFAADVIPFSAQFVAHELPADFVEGLNSDIAAMEGAIDSQSNAVGDHIAARAALDEAISRGVDAVRKLGAIIKNKYGEQPAVLAEWTSVSHTERSRRSRSPVPFQPTTSVTTPPAP